ncbi:hypothetical protein BDW75DRAFT_55801 [Aspergillus navahoensis]
MLAYRALFNSEPSDGIGIVQPDRCHWNLLVTKASLKKWHITKPSRKKYCSGKATSTEAKVNDKLSTPLGLTETPHDGSIPINPTPKTMSPLASTPPHDLAISNAPLDSDATPDHLDSSK